MKKPLEQSKGEGGSILMEYALLVFLAAIPVYLVWNGCSVPLDWGGGNAKIEYKGIYDFAKGQYKGYGKDMQKFFEMVQDGIALPIP
ncbi:MAG: hypothetical protein IJJ26_06615 [Victivallales bacterium]|nr:hypothetical protein [Victivallales bacterium]